MLPFGPRIMVRAASTVSPSSAVPSTDRTMSPGIRPARAAGEPSNDLVTRRRHAVPSGSQPWVPSAACEPRSAPMPSNWPLMVWRFC